MNGELIEEPIAGIKKINNLFQEGNCLQVP
jgi:hypothetical protein